MKSGPGINRTLALQLGALALLCMGWFAAAQADDSVVLHRITDNKWFTYVLGSTGVVDKGFLSFTRSPAYSTVSRSDFDGDGQADLLVRDLTPTKDENGRWVLYTLDGTTATSQGFVDGLTRSRDWKLLASEDVNGDNRADLLLRNTLDGRWLLYLMDGHSILGQGVLPLSTLLSDSFQGTGDFNADGRSDVLLRRADGTWLLYTLDGLSVQSTGTPAITSNLQFSLQSLADFNGDGRTDALVRRSDGRWFMYLLDGSSVVGQGSPAMTEVTDFQLQTVSDFNNDGKADVLLRRVTDGRWFIYLLDGTAILGSGSPDMTTNLGFELVKASDFTNDGKSDLLLRRTDGRWVLYALDGAAVGAKIVPEMTGNTAWLPQDVSAQTLIQIASRDDDGDGVANSTDNCRLVSNANQVNTDANLPNGDIFGDACDDDDDGDGASDDYEISCATDPLDPSEIASDVNNNSECDNLESNKLEVIGITPRFVRFSNFTGTLFDVRAKAVGVDVANDSIGPVMEYLTGWMSGPGGSARRIILNDDMLDGDEVANDFIFSWKGFFSDVIMPAGTIFADDAFNAQRFWFSLRDQNGDYVQPGKPLEQGFEVMLLRDDLPNVTVEDIAPGVKATSNTAFLTYDEDFVDGYYEQQVVQDFFTYFEDVNVIVIYSYESTIGNGNPDAGVVSNDVGGLNFGIYDTSASWGSNGALQLFVRMKDNMGWAIPHEVGHRWGFYANDPVGISTPRGAGFHIALSSLQGQMAGSGYMEEQPSGDFLWTSDDGNGNFKHRVFSDWMQYLACDIPKEEVSPMWIINPDFEDLYSFGDIVPRAHMTEVTIEGFIAANGERSLVGNQCQTVFSVGFVVVNKTENPLTPDDFTGYTAMHEYLLGNSSGRGYFDAGLANLSDMISLNATMSAGNISFVKGVVKKAGMSSAVLSKANAPRNKSSSKLKGADEIIIFIEEPIPEPLDFSLLE